jgi:hypothetical protein
MTGNANGELCETLAAQAAPELSDRLPLDRRWWAPQRRQNHSRDEFCKRLSCFHPKQDVKHRNGRSLTL